MKPVYAFMICLVFIAACKLNFGKSVEGSGNLVTTERQISNATKINVSGSMDVEIVQGAPGVSISADDNLMEYIVTETKGNTLEVHYKDHVNINTKNDVKVKISLENIEEANVSGSGSITSTGKIVLTNNINIGVFGSGDIKLKVNAPKVSTEVEGSGDIEITGETKEVRATINGSGKINTYSLMAENAKVNISGSGEIKVFADMSLDININGSGNIYYKGKAAAITQSINGSGEIIKE